MTESRTLRLNPQWDGVAGYPRDGVAQVSEIPGSAALLDAQPHSARGNGVRAESLLRGGQNDPCEITG